MLYAYSAKHLLFKSAYNGLFTARNGIKTAHNCIFTASDVARADPVVYLIGALMGGEIRNTVRGAGFMALFRERKTRSAEDGAGKWPLEDTRNADEGNKGY